MLWAIGALAVWVSGTEASALLAPWAKCPALVEAVAPAREGETLRVRPVPGGVDVNRYSAGSGRWATAYETTLRLGSGGCQASGLSLGGGKESLLARVGIVTAGGAPRPSLGQLAELASAMIVAEPDADPIAPARALASTLGGGPQPEHPGKPRGAPATLWSPEALARAGVKLAPLEDNERVDGLVIWPIRSPTPLRTFGRWQVWEVRFRARVGGGLLAVYDRARDRHRWLWGTELDEGLGGHFDVVSVRGDRLVVRTRSEGIETLVALDLATGSAREISPGEL